MSAQKTPKTKAPSAKPKKARKPLAEEAAPTPHPTADAPAPTTDLGPAPEPVAVEPVPAEPVTPAVTPVDPPGAAAEAAPAADEPPAGEPAQTPEPAPATTPRRRKAKKAEGDRPEKKLSALDAAAKVLARAGQAMTCPELIAAMAAKGYWSSPGGKTPHATVYAAILREIQTKGTAARFAKTERGKFARTTPGGEG
jgi:hypothetical protein